MSTDTLIDNWTLQSVGETLERGLYEDNSLTIAIDRDGDRFDYLDIPSSIIQIRCIINLLNDIVLRDALFVDPLFSSAWTSLSEIQRLQDSNIVRPSATSPTGLYGLQLKRKCAEELCVTSDMRALHAENEKSWEENRETIDPFFSQVVWGTAGYLARSGAHQMPYSPYAVRNDLLQQTAFQTNKVDTTAQVSEWLRSEGLDILETVTPNTKHRTARFILPPIATIIIDETSDMQQLIRTAIEARDEYAKLRQWISEYQASFDREDARDILSRRKLLKSVSKFSSARMSGDVVGETKLKLSYKFFRIFELSRDQQIPDPRQLFGIRGVMNRLILTKAGVRPIRKLLEGLGGNPLLVDRVVQALSQT